MLRDAPRPSNVAYKDLTTEESATYIPRDILEPGAIHSIKTTTVYQDWVEAIDHPYIGSLTYVATKDKEIHMVDDNGVKHQYTMDNFRPMIPYLCNGRISGTFHYKAQGSSRQAKYVLVLATGKQANELEVCDSSSSDED